MANETMTEKKYTWHKIADHINELGFAENNIAVAEMKGKKSVSQNSRSVFAFAYKCPACRRHTGRWVY